MTSLALIELRNSDVECIIAPELGGALLSLMIGGTQVLRPLPDTPTDALMTACFPLVPFANRIANGRFSFASREIALPADEAALPHAHHGHGWRKQWTVSALSAVEAEMTYLHYADEWPWTYRATQRLTLLPDGLAIHLEVENQSNQPMPCGFGMHPYFALEQASYVEINAPSRLLPDVRGIPCISASGIAGRHAISTLPDSDDLLLDTSGHVRVGTTDWEMELSAERSIGWQFYVPPDRTFFCLEPVSHRPDSFNLVETVNTIAPQEVQNWPFAIRRTR